MKSERISTSPKSLSTKKRVLSGILILDHLVLNDVDAYEMNTIKNLRI